MKVAICDDEKLYVNEIYAYIQNFSLKTKKNFEIQSFLSANDFLAIIAHEKFDIIFLDIAMPDINGIELAKHIRRIDDKVSIVFITYMSEKMPQGFEVMAAGFLVKPINETDIEKVIERIVLMYEKNRNIPFEIKTKGSGTAIVNMNDILYFESFLHYINVITKESNYEFRGSISQISSDLSKWNFMQIHRAYLVNMAYVWIVYEDRLTLINSKELPIGKKYIDSFKNAFRKYKKGNLMK